MIHTELTKFRSMYPVVSTTLGPLMAPTESIFSLSSIKGGWVR